MAYHALAQTRTLPELFHYFLVILGPERKFYLLAIVYGIGISLLSLATPISVQMLINTVANTGLTTPLVVLSLTLFALLSASALLQALRIHLMDLFGRRFYARMVSEIALRSIYAVNPFFDDNSKGPLFNRYFDIIIVQKRLPVLFVGGFTIVLQTVVGVVLVSFYHPLLMAFNLVLVALLALTWLVWGKRAMRSAMEVSHKKHATAAWLGGLGSSNGFFKTSRHIADALHKTEVATADYIKSHKTHFRHHFAQTLTFLFIYAAASASLLGLGGWLVIQGQLTLGQLVAAELVLSVVFVGISQLGTYLTYFYDLCAAVEELSLFHDVEQDPPEAHQKPVTGDASLRFHQARGETRGADVLLDLAIPSGSRLLATASHHAVQRVFTNFLKRHEFPESGYITLGDQDFQAYRTHQLRQEIIVLDRPNVVESTLREYLYFSSLEEDHGEILDVLRAVGLAPTIERLSQGLDTRVAATGWPLSTTETMQLKLAAAIIASPRVLVLSHIFDVMPETCLLNSLDRLQATGESTVVYFSNRHCDLNFDGFLYLDDREQTLFKSYEGLCLAAGLPAQPLAPIVGSHAIEEAS
jgi:putative ABC transport system ATP-binding protein